MASLKNYQYANINDYKGHFSQSAAMLTKKMEELGINEKNRPKRTSHATTHSTKRELQSLYN